MHSHARTSRSRTWAPAAKQTAYAEVPAGQTPSGQHDHTYGDMELAWGVYGATVGRLSAWMALDWDARGARRPTQSQGP